MTTIIKARLFALAAAGALAGCASAPTVDGTFGQPGPAPEQPPTLAIEVRHDVPIATSLAIYLVEPGGIPRRIGRVPPGAIATFELNEFPVTGDYRLIAETTTGRAAVSLPFSLQHTNGVRWDIDLNRVTPIIEGRF
jgi:hypothetical protein